MGKFTYRNISKQKLILIGIGEVEPGKTIESDDELHNDNLELVSGKRFTGVDPVTEIPRKK